MLNYIKTFITKALISYTLVIVINMTCSPTSGEFIQSRSLVIFELRRYCKWKITITSILMGTKQHWHSRLKTGALLIYTIVIVGNPTVIYVHIDCDPANPNLASEGTALQWFLLCSVAKPDLHILFHSFRNFSGIIFLLFYVVLVWNCKCKLL